MLPLCRPESLAHFYADHIEETPVPNETFKSAAGKGFTELARQYKIPGIFSGNFWFGGNTFHTCLDYMVGAGGGDPQNIVQTAYNVYKDAQTNTGWWRDDYAWWGDSFVLALNNRPTLGYSQDLFDAMTTAAEFCWRQLRNNQSNTTYGSTPKDNAAGTANITGGAYNVFTDQDQPPMQGRNSVTNEGFWLLSVGLAQRNPTAPAYAQAATAMANWYQQWLTLPNRVPGAVGILNPNGLVLERPTGNSTAPAWYWSGDQGLFSRALFTSNSVADRQKALDIANATIGHMTDGQGVLHENLGFMNYQPLTQFLGDYATGKGIFMRSLVELNVGPVRPFDGFIKKNATEVWCKKGTPDNASQFLFNWNRAPGYEPNVLSGGKSADLNNLIMQAAGQDALQCRDGDRTRRGDSVRMMPGCG
jgi:hypothetical protein